MTNTQRTIAIVAGALLAVGGLVALFLPSLLQGFGLHPEYTGSRYELANGRALIISTSHDELGEGGAETGVAASELTAPYYELLDGGLDVDVASVEGGQVPVDPLTMMYFIKTHYDDRYLEDEVLLEKMENSLRIDDVDFTQYDIIFLAGGWGAAYDLGQSEVLGDKMTEAWAAGKVVGGVCHGPLGLLKARDEEGTSLVEGRRITAVTDKQVRELGITVTPLHPEAELRKAGAEFEGATASFDFFANHVVADGRLVTGQNQNAGAEVANLMMKIAGGTSRVANR